MSPVPSVAIRRHQDLEADCFAVELLMPRKEMLTDVPKPLHPADHEKRVKELAKRYGVSALMMSARLSELGRLKW